MAVRADFSLGSITCSGTVVLVPGGDLTADAAPVLSARLSEFIDLLGRRRIVIDLRRAHVIDPAAIDVLVNASGWVGALGGSLTLEHVTAAAEAAIAGRVPTADSHPPLEAPPWR